MTYPLFKSHYSVGKSILTLKEAGGKKDGPKSIIDLCLDNGIERPFLVEDGVKGFIEASKNFNAAKIDFIPAVRVPVTKDVNIKDDKKCFWMAVIVFKGGYESYLKFIKAHNKMTTENFYYTPRTDMNELESFWDEDLFDLVIPFYDSFIFKNRFEYGHNFAPNVAKFKPKFFIEDNGVTYDHLLQPSVKLFADAIGAEVFKSKTIYYDKKEDFQDYLAFKCIHKRMSGGKDISLEKPNLDQMMSDEFCVESWKEKK